MRKNWKQSKWPSINEWFNNPDYLTTKYYLAMKKEQIIDIYKEFQGYHDEWKPISKDHILYWLHLYDIKEMTKSKRWNTD